MATNGLNTTANGQNGQITPGELSPIRDGLLEVHPTAARRQNPITVQSEHTKYTDEHITASYTNRGAFVTVGAAGEMLVKPTSETIELRTQRKVPKTGYVKRLPFQFTCRANKVFS